MYSAI